MDEDRRDAPSAEDEALTRLGEAEVRRELSTLSEDHRDVLALRILGDLTVEQVAQVLGKRPGAVKALQRRGLETLRRRISAGAVPLGTSPTMTGTR